MSQNTRGDIKTQAIVLRRTNYAEADRILNLITPSGKMSVIVKGARKEKSKLAGGVEMFSLVELNIHQGRSEMGVVTSARMLKYYNALVADLNKMELAGMILKKINRTSEGADEAAAKELFKITNESLAGMNEGMDLRLVEAWFLINLLKISGEEINLYRDIDGAKLVVDGRYDWNAMEKVFVVRDNGEFGAEEIKIMRLMSTTGLKIVTRVKNLNNYLDKILNLVRIMIK